MKNIAKIIIMSSCLVSSAYFQVQARGFPPASVNVIKAEVHQLSPSIWVSGTVSSNNDSKIAAEISGRLTTLSEIGRIVKKGDVLAEIDDSNLKIEILEHQANVLQAQADLTYIEAEVTRTTSLVQKKLSPKTELEKITSNRDVAKGRLMVAKARLSQKKNNLTFTKLKAPFSGIVAERIANLGEYVNSGNAIVRLVEIKNKEAIIFAPITSYQYINKKKTLLITSPMGEGEAPIKSFVPVANAQSHLMEVRLDMSLIKWPIGLNIKAQVANGPSVEAISLPRDALVLRREGVSVFRINSENKAEKISVEVGVSVGDLVSIKNASSDINIGDLIVIRGAERLQPGQEVAIKNNNDKLVSGNSSSEMTAKKESTLKEAK